MTSEKDLIPILQKHSFYPLFINNFSVNNISKIDLSIKNIELKNINIFSEKELSDYIFSKIKNENTTFGIGGYLENRSVYRSSRLFGEGDDARTIHLGIDIWCEPGTEISCPENAIVHSFNNNNNFKDYGPTVILEHHIDNIIFFTLYGHLSLKSIKNINAGKRFRKGEKIAEIGNPSENGNWPPHLHFQIILDMMNYRGDFPGVVSKNDISFFSRICPNPNFLLKL